MNNNPRLSVVIPVYNAEKYIAKMLELLVKQSYRDIEIVCVNDGSKDKSLDILEAFAKDDSRVKVISQENMGAGQARNVGLENAKGELFWFVDADDEITLDACEKIIVEFDKKPKLDVLVFNAYKMENGQIKKRYVNPKKIKRSLNTNKNLFLTATPVIWNKVYSRALIGKYELRYQNIKSCNDHSFAMLGLALARQVFYLDEFLYFYNLDVQSAISRNRGNTSLCVLLAAKHIQEKLKEFGIYDSNKDAYFSFYIYAICYEFVFSSQKQELLKGVKDLLPEEFYKKFVLKLRKRKLKYNILSKFTFGKIRKKYKMKSDSFCFD